MADACFPVKLAKHLFTVKCKIKGHAVIARGLAK